MQVNITLFWEKRQGTFFRAGTFFRSGTFIRINMVVRHNFKQCNLSSWLFGDFAKTKGHLSFNDQKLSRAIYFFIYTTTMFMYLVYHQRIHSNVHGCHNRSKWIPWKTHEIHGGKHNERWQAIYPGQFLKKMWIFLPLIKVPVL